MARRDHHFRVAGVTFRPGYPMTFHRLAETLEQEQAEGILDTSEWSDITRIVEGPAVVLMRDPENPHDPNAIEVHVPALGADGWVGFVPKKLAARWAPILDKVPPPIHESWVEAVAIDPRHLEKPGLQVLVRVHDEECPVKSGHPCTCAGEPIIRDWSEYK